MEKAKSLYDGYGNILLGLLAFLLIVFTLFGGDEIGLSDNGDFDRVMRTNSIEKTDDGSSFVYVSGYKMSLEGESAREHLEGLLLSTENAREYPSVHLLFVRVSTLGNYLFNWVTGADLALYRMGALGLIYTLCYSLAISWFFSAFRFPNRIMDLLCKALALVVLCDSGYTAYFNSFYSEPVQIIGFVLMLAACLRLISRPKPGVRDVVYLVLFAALYGWSRFANLPVALLVIVVFSVITYLRCRRASVLQVMTVSIAAVLCLFILVPEGSVFENNYNAVFSGVLYDTQEEQQKEYLQDLGLPEEYQALAGTRANTAQIQDTLHSEAFQEFFSHIDTPQLLLFYLKHPGQLLKLADVAIQNSGFLRPYYLSNYSGAHPRFTQTHRFSFWSDLRAQLGFDSALVNGLLVLLFIVLFLLFQSRREKQLDVKLRAQSVLCILLMVSVLLYNLLVPVIRGGVADVSGNVFSYAQMMDLLLFATLFMAVQLCAAMPVRKMLPGLAGGLLAVLIVGISPVMRFAAAAQMEAAAHTSLETGAYIQLGTLEGEPLIWQAVSEEEGVIQLMSSESIGEHAFSLEGEFGSNYWPDSGLRQWLNGDFLQSFTDAEKAAISETTGENRFLLSGVHQAKAAGGTGHLNSTNIPSLAADGYEKAVYGTAADRVFLPDIAMISSLSRRQDIALSGCYWLDTPYYGSGSMLRAVFPDGHIYFRDACETAEVRPVVQIRDREVLSGAGSREDPFILSVT